MTAHENRKSPRLPQYDYSRNGAYFVTICTAEKRKVLSKIVGGGVLDAPSVLLSKYGAIVKNTLLSMNNFYDDIFIDKYVVMPNHIHFIVTITGQGGSSRTPTPTNMRLPVLISTLKRFTNRSAGISLWQRSYYDHIIRNEADYLRIWQYIDENPAHWTEDEYYSE